MAFFRAILLGMVQGLTEFLPVSSSGHLVFIRSFFEGFQPPGIAYEVLLHGATLLAILIFYRRRVINLVKSVFYKEEGAEHRLIFLLVIGTLPAAIAGVFFKSEVEHLFMSLGTVAAMWIVTALFLFIGHASRAGERGLEQLNWKDAVLIGIAQAFAIMPGVSRSGVTISVALMLRVRGSAAAEFSFLLAIPSIMGALLLETGEIGSIMKGPYICGAIAALLSGLLAIYILLGVLKQRKLIYFAFYCLALGLATLVLT